MEQGIELNTVIYDAPKILITSQEGYFACCLPFFTRAFSLYQVPWASFSHVVTNRQQTKKSQKKKSRESSAVSSPDFSSTSRVRV